jgi:hypothetical protein
MLPVGDWATTARDRTAVNKTVLRSDASVGRVIEVLILALFIGFGTWFY